MDSAPRDSDLTRNGRKRSTVPDTVQEHYYLLGAQLFMRENCAAVEVIDPGALLTAIIYDASPFPLPKNPRLVRFSPTVGTAESRGMQLFDEPGFAEFQVEQWGDRLMPGIRHFAKSHKVCTFLLEYVQ